MGSCQAEVKAKAEEQIQAEVKVRVMERQV